LYVIGANAEQDYPITNTDLYLIWAYGNSDGVLSGMISETIEMYGKREKYSYSSTGKRQTGDYVFSKHTSRGSGKVNFFSGTSNLVSEDESKRKVRTPQNACPYA
jgi:hypothetical protein